MKKYLLIFILIFSLLYTQESSNNTLLNIDDFYDDRFDATILHLDYNNIYKSSFLLDKYFPNHLIDYKLYGLILNGGSNESIYQMVPEKIYFNTNELGRMSQLTYKEKKTYDYFNTKIAIISNPKKCFCNTQSVQKWDTSFSSDCISNYDKATKVKNMV